MLQDVMSNENQQRCLPVPLVKWPVGSIFDRGEGVGEGGWVSRFVVLPPKVLWLRICRRFLDKYQAEVDYGIWPLHILVREEGLPEMNFLSEVFV